MRFDAENVLQTVDWAHAMLRHYGAASGYAMDAIMAKRVSRFRGNPDSGRGHFARYLRGESSPSWETAIDLDFGDRPVTDLIYLPLYAVLRIGMDGYRYGRDDIVEEALLDVERRFQRRLTRYYDRGVVMTRPELNPRYGLDLCSYGSSYALTVLLAAAMQFQLWAEDSYDRADDDGRSQRSSPVSRSYDSLLMGQRAFQCLILAIAAGEFPVTYALVSARVRQRVLDQLSFNGAVLDTAAIRMEAAVQVGRQALQQAVASGRTPSRQRAWLRAWLKDRDNSDCLMITPPIVTPAQAAESRAQNPVMLHLASPPLGRHSHRHQLGRKAKKILIQALDGYIAKDNQCPDDAGLGSRS